MYPIWTWDDANEGYHPTDEFTAYWEEHGDLFIKSNFKAADGTDFSGYLAGCGDFHAFSFYIDEEEIGFNLNMPDFADQAVEEIRRRIGKPDLQLFPLAYDAGIKDSDGEPIKGVFERRDFSSPIIREKVYQLMRELRVIYRERSVGYVQKFKETLAKTKVYLNHPSAVTSLLTILYDKPELDETLLSIIDTIEAAEDEVYSKGVIVSLPILWTSSPHWAELVHTRILNSPTVSDTYLHLLKKTGKAEKQAAREIFRKIADNHPELKRKADEAAAMID